MGVIKYSRSIIAYLTKDESFKVINSILKRFIFPIQYENLSKCFVVAKIEQIWGAPAGELIIIDIKEVEKDKTEVLLFSKDFPDVGMNFNRNVKNVERLIHKINITIKKVAAK